MISDLGSTHWTIKQAANEGGERKKEKRQEKKRKD